MSKTSQLFLLADHIKLSLLERRRASSIEARNDSDDGHISRSLEQFQKGLDALEHQRLEHEQQGDLEYVTCAAVSLLESLAPFSSLC